MPIKDVTVIQDVCNTKDALYAVLVKYADSINKAGVVIEECLNWIICNEIESVFGFIVQGHNPKLSPYRNYYDIVVGELGSHLLTKYIRHSICVPWLHSEDNTVVISINEMDIRITYRIKYETDNELNSKLRFFK